MYFFENIHSVSLLLYCFQAILAVVLLFNISIDVLYYVLPSTTMHVAGGVIAFDASRFNHYPRSWMQGLVMTSFGGASGHPMSIRAAVTFTGVYAADFCPPDADSCLQLYLTQAPPQLGSLPRFQLPGYVEGDTRKSTFFKMLNTPLYHIIISKALGSFEFPRESCRDYGYTEFSLQICATEYVNTLNQTFLVIGEDYL